MLADKHKYKPRSNRVYKGFTLWSFKGFTKGEIEIPLWAFCFFLVQKEGVYISIYMLNKYLHIYFKANGKNPFAYKTNITF